MNVVADCWLLFFNSRKTTCSQLSLFPLRFPRLIPGAAGHFSQSVKKKRKRSATKETFDDKRRWVFVASRLCFCFFNCFFACCTLLLFVERKCFETFSYSSHVFCMCVLRVYELFFVSSVCVLYILRMQLKYIRLFLKCFASKIKSRQTKSIAEIKIIWKKEGKIEKGNRKNTARIKYKG